MAAVAVEVCRRINTAEHWYVLWLESPISPRQCDSQVPYNQGLGVAGSGHACAPVPCAPAIVDSLHMRTPHVLGTAWRSPVCLPGPAECTFKLSPTTYHLPPTPLLPQASVSRRLLAALARLKAAKADLERKSTMPMAVEAAKRQEEVEELGALTCLLLRPIRETVLHFRRPGVI